MCVYVIYIHICVYMYVTCSICRIGSGPDQDLTNVQGTPQLSAPSLPVTLRSWRALGAGEALWEAGAAACPLT